MHVAVRTNVVAVGEPHRLQTGRGVGVEGWGTWRIEGVCNHHFRGAGRAGGKCALSEGRQHTSHAQSRGRRGARELGERSR